MPYTFRIETLGCQMNVLDSELATALLIEKGFQAALSQDLADIVLINTCSIRQHAEDKVYSSLGRLKKWKEERPTRVIGILGCMAQKDKGLIFKRAPHVDLVLGPGQLEQLPFLINDILEKRQKEGIPTNKKERSDQQRLEVSLERGSEREEEVQASFRTFDPKRLPQVRENRFQAMVRVMFGCNKFCSYCVVPSVRGPEQSRNPREIEEEVRQLADQGCLEITFIGQTVNSYRFKQGDRTVRLPDLLEMAHTIPGIERIRFITNYPRGMTDSLLKTVRDLPKVAPYFHVPAQSGSDSVLKRMKRHYSAREYYDLLDRIRSIVPNAAITSDFIVGFCGETEEEFAQTAEMVKRGRFKNSFIFKYSERPGTTAFSTLADDVLDEVKQRRNNELLAIQDAISLELNREFIGRKVQVLVEKRNDREPDQLLGRTECDRIVAFQGPGELVGTFCEVGIEDALPFTLLAQTVLEK
ncbi:MAG: tRNA (N6-isopentenyl adenosine(37)-C2)-methylthiotransferase MiaB [Thermoguttaceae bacterium]